MIETFNGWIGRDISWALREGQVYLHGELLAGPESWGLPAFVVDDEVRPENDQHFGSILSVLTDGRVIPYASVRNKADPFLLDAFGYFPRAILADPIMSPPDPPDVLPMDDNGLTPAERSLAWICFWPEWVARQIARKGRETWWYLVALHTLWSKEQEGGSKHGD